MSCLSFLLSFFALLFVAGSLANCIVLKAIILHLSSFICHLANRHLASNLWPVLLSCNDRLLGMAL